MSSNGVTEVPALKVRQWLEAWENINFDPAQRQSKPKDHFYLFSLPASTLRSLAGISRRSVEDGTPRSEDIGIQRRHDPERSKEIRRYVDGGYPWSALSDAKRGDPENNKLKKPGWLPTAIVVNILEPGDERRGVLLPSDQAVSISQTSAGSALLRLPNLDSVSEGMLPIEVIDGQHRLYAFDGNDEEAQQYDLPVVAFHGLDISWQAYLFWTINIKPKKINPSLAFDLYPLLREQDWLEAGEAVQVYRESRAQELTEMLWSIPNSPWYKRVNMLGGNRKQNGPVTQAAFIRSLNSSLVKSWRPINGIGGLFGGRVDGNEGLSWSRVQQSAFLLTAWQLIADKVRRTSAEWSRALSEESGEFEFAAWDNEFDSPAFSGQSSLLATDQGVRGFQHVVNDLCYVRHDRLQLEAWRDPDGSTEVRSETVMACAESLRQQPVFKFLDQVTESLASFDWRTSSATSLTPEERLAKSALRGSGGYKLLRDQLITHLLDSPYDDVSTAARFVKL